MGIYTGYLTNFKMQFRNVNAQKKLLLFLFIKRPGDPLFCPYTNDGYDLSGLYLGCVFDDIDKEQKISLYADLGKSQFKE